jgi:hypothetical protein
MNKARKILMSTTAIVAAGAAGLAIAQTYPPAYVTNFNGANDAVQVIPGGAGTVPSVYTHPNAITTTYGYQKVVQTDSTVVTMGNNQSYLLFSSGTGGTGGALKVLLPPTPNDGQRFCVRSVNGIVTGDVSFSATAGNASITFGAASPTGLAAATTTCWLFSSSNLTWDVD